MLQITLQDLLQRTPEEILKKMREISSEKVFTKVKEPSRTIVQHDKGKINRALYRGALSHTKEFTKGQTFPFENHTIQVINVEKSSGRVRFVKMDTEEIFSLAFSTLTGTEKEMPYKKGDWVIFEEQCFQVTGLNPASKNVVIDYHGKTRYVKLSKIKPKVVHIDEPDNGAKITQGIDSNVPEKGLGSPGSEI